MEKLTEGCPLLQTCAFFNGRLNNMSAYADMLKQKHCLKSYNSCARYMVATKKGREYVTDDLLPHHKEKADKIIEK